MVVISHIQRVKRVAFSMVYQNFAAKIVKNSDISCPVL